MIHDMRPAVMDAIRGSMNRRGALAALFAAIPLASLGGEHAAAMRNQRHGKHAAKSEGKSKKKAKAGPPGPQGGQGPAGARGPAGERGPEGPKAITSHLVMRQNTCNVPVGQSSSCSVSCVPGEIVVSGGFETGMQTVIVHMSARDPDDPLAWIVRVYNTGTGVNDLIAMVYCLPT